MANEVTNALLVTNGGRVAEALDDSLFQLAYDGTDLRSVATFYPWAAGSGSATMSVTTIPAPGAATAATSEVVGGVANSAFTTGEFSLTVARYLRRLEMSDLAAITAPAGGVDFNLLLRQLAMAEGLTFTDLICGLSASITANVGTSGADMTVDDFYSAIYVLEIANIGGPFSVVLHPVQWTNFQESMRSEGGAVQYRADTQGVIQAAEQGYKGSFAGVEIWTSDSVNTANAGADRQGFMFGNGAFAYSSAPIAAINPLIGSGDVLMQGESWVIERDRSAANGLTGALINLYPAVALAEDVRAVTITTDA